MQQAPEFRVGTSSEIGSEISLKLSPELSPELSDDLLLGGRLRVRQPVKGYRAGLDAALLAAALDLAPGERALEAGCGVGGALLPAAVRQSLATFVGIERDSSAAALAVENAGVNGLADRVEIRQAEVATGAKALGLAGFDHAFANPPFFDDPSALRGPAPERRGAWMADDGLAAWLGFLLDALKPGGRVTVIHRADRLGDLLRLLGEGAGSLAVRAIHPVQDEAAKRVLVRAVKGGKAPLRLLPPLILHGGDGASTLEAAAILRGEAALPFDAPSAQAERIKVRPYRADDAPGLVTLFGRSVREAAASHYTQAQRLAWAPDRIDLRAFAAGRAAKPTWVAEIAGALAGFTDLEPTEGFGGHIDMLYVSADHQRRGVASLLYRAVEAKARGQGMTRLFTEASLLARPFFEAKGFIVIAEQSVERRGERLTNFRMEKRLG